MNVTDTPTRRLRFATSNELEILAEHFHERQPFGPEDASKIQNKDAAWLVFNPANELCNAYKRSPRLIVGRRGSGKTSMVSNTHELENHDLTVEINTAEAIEYVRDAVFDDISPDDTFVERVAEFWEFCLDALLVKYAVSKFGSDKLPKCKKFLVTFELNESSYIAEIVRSARKNITSSGDGAGGFFIRMFYEWLHSGESNFSDAKDELLTHIRDNNLSSVIIIDSIEDYKLQNERNAAALQGLLKCIGSYGTKNRSIRLCMPGETFFELRKLSSNLMKDFADCLLLQWLPSEVLSVLAWRYLIYLRIYNQDRLRLFNGISLRNRNDVRRVISDFLEENLENSLGVSEVSLTYILRHSQLLPRQLVLIMNSVSGDTKVGYGEKINGTGIVKGIRECEETICHEIFGAFRHKYPFGSDLCRRVIPELPKVFSDGDLHSVFNERGRKILRQFPVEVDYDYFKECLIEMGVVGRIRGKTSKYLQGEFEYARPGRLDVSHRDELCLHPLFSGVYESNVNRDKIRFVYPHYHWMDDQGASDRKIWTSI